MEKDYQDNLSTYKNQQDKLQQEIERLKVKAKSDVEQQSKEFREEIDRMKNNHEKRINELTSELDQVRVNGEFLEILPNSKCWTIVLLF